MHYDGAKYYGIAGLDVSSKLHHGVCLIPYNTRWHWYWLEMCHQNSLCILKLSQHDLISQEYHLELLGHWQLGYFQCLETCVDLGLKWCMHNSSPMKIWISIYYPSTAYWSKCYNDRPMWVSFCSSDSCFSIQHVHILQNFRQSCVILQVKPYEHPISLAIVSVWFSCQCKLSAQNTPQLQWLQSPLVGPIDHHQWLSCTCLWTSLSFMHHLFL